MTVSELITLIVAFVIAGILALLSIQSFRERGFLLNNAYIFASEEERKTMDKKPHYRQSAIVFCLLSIVFIIIGLSIIFHNSKIELLEIPVIMTAFIYAIVSSVRVNRQTKK